MLLKSKLPVKSAQRLEILWSNSSNAQHEYRGQKHSCVVLGMSLTAEAGRNGASAYDTELALHIVERVSPIKKKKMVWKNCFFEERED